MTYESKMKRNEKRKARKYRDTPKWELSPSTAHHLSYLYIYDIFGCFCVFKVLMTKNRCKTYLNIKMIS